MIRPMEPLPGPPLPDWLARLAPFHRWIADLGDHRIHVMETGSGFPVLLLHGNPMWGFLYRKVAKALSDEPLRLIMPDLIGLGFSDRPSSEWHTLENHARWIGRLIEELQLDRLLLVVHDWGGPIGLRALADRQDKLAGLVVLNTVVDPPRPGFRPTAFHRFSHVPVFSQTAFRLFGFPQNALHRVQADPQSIRGEVGRAYRYPLRGLKNNAAPLALARMVPTSLQHPSIGGLKICGEFAQKIEVPTAIVWGDGDPILGRALKRMTRLFPRAKVIRTSAGHFLQEEVPEEIVEGVRWVFGELKRGDLEE